MARKKKGFGELIKQKKKAQDERKNLEKLARKVQSGPLQNRNTKMLIEPKGAAKMSEVLEDFIDPYLDIVGSKQEHKRLLEVAIMAWNTALMPKTQQSKLFDKMIEEGLSGQDPQAVEDFREIMKDMIARKRRYFSKHRRYILDFSLQGTGKDLYLSVVATLDPSEVPDE